MRAVSAAFQTAITTQTDARSIYAKILFEAVDATIVGDATTTADSTENAELTSDPQFATDGTDTAYNYASFETDRWDLTKGFKLVPPSGYENMGWWSLGDNLSDVTTMEFGADINLDIDFTTDHSSAGLTILFDVNNDEWAEEFDLVFYDSTPAVIITVNVTGNTLSRYSYETEIVDYRFIDIAIKKWSKGDRRARIAEVKFGISKEFSTSNGKLVDMKILEEIDLTSAVLPSNTVSFSIDNSDGEYDFYNPTGSFAYLKLNQKIETFLGVKLATGDIEYTETGTFYLKKWRSDTNEITATFNGVDKLLLLHEEKYNDGILEIKKPLSTLADEVLTAFGLAAAEFNIDTALDTIYMDGYLPICTYREAIQYIAIAGQAVVYMDRDNVLIIEQATYPVSGLTLGFDNIYNSPTLDFIDLPKKVVVDVNTYTTASSATEVYKAEIYVDSVGGTDVAAFFNYPIDENEANGAAAVVTGGTNNGDTFYSNYAVVNIIKNPAGLVTLTISGKVLTKNTVTWEAQPSPSHVGANKVYNVKSPLVTTNQTDAVDFYEVADDVATWVLTEVNRRNKLRVDWRINPALELLDKVNIEYLLRSGGVRSKTSHTAESGTTTTNIKWTAHGLATDDWIYNSTRMLHRKITYVDADNFTVTAVTGQTTGDTIETEEIIESAIIVKQEMNYSGGLSGSTYTIK